MKAVGYRKSLPVDACGGAALFRGRQAGAEGRDIRVAVKAISANPVDYKVASAPRRRKATPRFWAMTPPAWSTRSAPR